MCHFWHICEQAYWLDDATLFSFSFLLLTASIFQFHYFCCSLRHLLYVEIAHFRGLRCYQTHWHTHQDMWRTCDGASEPQHGTAWHTFLHTPSTPLLLFTWWYWHPHNTVYGASLSLMWLIYYIICIINLTPCHEKIEKLIANKHFCT